MPLIELDHLTKECRLGAMLGKRTLLNSAARLLKIVKITDMCSSFGGLRPALTPTPSRPGGSESFPSPRLRGEGQGEGHEPPALTSLAKRDESSYWIYDCNQADIQKPRYQANL